MAKIHLWEKQRANATTFMRTLIYPAGHRNIYQVSAGFKNKQIRVRK